MRLTGAQAEGADGYTGCGIGEGAACCAFLLFDMDGFECGRATKAEPVIRQRVADGLWTSRRLPAAPFPMCQSRETTT